MSGGARVSIIIVNFNTSSVLRDCLASLYATDGSASEVIVIDNASSDGSPEMVSREFPAVRLIRNSENAGFAKANNQGIRAATGRYLLLLNSDTIVRSGALAAMATCLDSTPTAGAAACKLLNRDGTVQASVHDRPGPTLLLFRLLGISRLVRGDKARRWLRRLFGGVLGKTVRSYLIPYNTAAVPVEVEGLSGACLMLRREAVEQVGVLDERFFMYLEDLDYCLRLRQFGWKLYYVASGEIVHLVGASSGNRMRHYSVESFRSLFKFYQKHFSRPTAILTRSMVVIAVSVQWLWNWTASKLSSDSSREQNARDLKEILRASLRFPTARAADRFTVVFLMASLTGGGAERVFMTLLRHLDRGRFRVRLILLRSGGEFAGLVPDDVAVETLDGDRDRRLSPGLVVVMWRLIRLLRATRPDAVLSTGSINLMLALVRPALPRTTRIVIRESSVLSVRLNTDTRWPSFWCFLYRRFYRRADVLVCQSDSTARDMVERFGVPRKKVARIHNPIDLTLVRELASRGGTPYSGPGPHIVAAGRLSPEKGFDRLLEAMSKVVEELPTVQLTILGRGPLERALVRQTERLRLTDSVRFAGFQQNPWPYLRHADFLVLPSRREGFSNVLLEALALGVPAIAVDCPGAIRELYGDHPGVRVVPDGEVPILANAILEECKARHRPRGGAIESEAWITKFDVRHIVSEYGDILATRPASQNVAANRYDVGLRTNAK